MVMASTDLRNLVYMDYNATTPLAEEVVEGISNSLKYDWGNPSSFHPYGARAKSAVSKARKQISEMVNCNSSDIIFTSGGTEANNMVIQSAVSYFQDQKAKLKFGEKPHIITSNVEHDSILLPIKHLEEQGIVTSTIVKVQNNGCIKIEDVIAKITEQTCLITLMYANNETGVIMPIAALGKLIVEINSERKRKQLMEILFHTDAAQAIGKDFVDFQSLNVHYMTIVGHKFYGPRIGCLVWKYKLYPILFGGNQEQGLRPGTENTPMIVGLGIAAKLIKNNLNEYINQMLMLRETLESRLQQIFGNDIVINCEESLRLPNTSNISFRTFGLEGALVLSRCKSLVASIGAACHNQQVSQVLINSGVSPELAKNSIRLSVGRDLTLDAIDIVINDLANAVNKLKANLVEET